MSMMMEGLDAHSARRYPQATNHMSKFFRLIVSLIVLVSASSPLMVLAAEKTLPYGAPVKFEISRLGIIANVEKTSISKAGILEAPKKPANVGWYRNGTIPGQPGNAFISGHLNTFTSTAIFWKLNKIRVGDVIVITNDKHQKLKFKVTKKAVYPWRQAPLKDMLGATKARHLNLITCAGTWSHSQHNYSHRLVVFSTLVK
jgi:sortase A